MRDPKALTRSTPASAAELRHALTRLNLALSPNQQVSAALYVGLPVDVVPSLTCTRGRATLSFRSQVVPLRTETPESVCEDVAGLVASTHVAGDQYPDPDGPVVSWVRVVRSGTRRLVFGTRTLLGLPEVVAESGVSESDVRDVLTEASVVPPAVPAVVCGVIVDGSVNQWVLRSTKSPTPAPPPPPVDLDETAEQILTEVSGESVSVVLIGEYDARVIVDCGSFEVVVPVRYDAGALLVGVPASDEDHVGAAELPTEATEYVVLSAGAVPGETIALHEPSGLRVIVSTRQA